MVLGQAKQNIALGWVKLIDMITLTRVSGFNLLVNAAAGGSNSLLDKLTET